MTFFLLFLSNIVTTIILIFTNKDKHQSQLNKMFTYMLICMLLWNVALISQYEFSELLGIPEVYFDYVSYIGICFLPVTLYFMSLSFINTKFQFSKKHLIFIVIPAISLLVLWTNDFHHLFYQTYSTNMGDCVYGSYFTIHTIYSYGLIFFALFNLIRYSIRNSGFFSKQSILFALAIFCPAAVNVIGTLKIYPITSYLTSISFNLAIVFLTWAIFKFRFLSVAPIALQRIVDRISDCYIVLNDNNVITDFNQTFLTTFKLKENDVRNVNIFDLLNTTKNDIVDRNVLNDVLETVKNSSKTISFDKHFESFGKYFHIEINTIISKGNFLGTLILLKDVTQHMEDMETIRDNQDMLMEKERLASLGQLIGGIAHNLKTPIMSISGAAEGLSDLTKEYRASVGDPEVTTEDHYDIAKDMDSWIEKIRSYTEYMSDVITAVKGQAVTMSDEQAVSFTLDELVKRVNILMKHELKNALVTLNVKMDTTPATTLQGNINSLVQVINNMISNGIQAYNGEPNNEINLILERNGNDIVISIQDFASGLPDEVQAKLFKEMITTKGKNGSGLGLFMSYSTIRAHFNGNVTFETAKGKGTTFHISFPI